MAEALDPVTGKPIGVWRVSPPKVILAENGYVLSAYDAVNDKVTCRIATSAEEVREALREWADKVTTDLRAAVERDLPPSVRS